MFRSETGSGASARYPTRSAAWWRSWLAALGRCRVLHARPHRAAGHAASLQAVRRFRHAHRFPLQFFALSSERLRRAGAGLPVRPPADALGPAHPFSFRFDTFRRDLDGGSGLLRAAGCLAAPASGRFFTRAAPRHADLRRAFLDPVRDRVPGGELCLRRIDQRRGSPRRWWDAASGCCAPAVCWSPFASTTGFSGKPRRIIRGSSRASGCVRRRLHAHVPAREGRRIPASAGACLRRGRGDPRGFAPTCATASATPFYLWFFAVSAVGSLVALPFNTYSVFYAKSLSLDQSAYGKVSGVDLSLLAHA